ncbi:cell envelope biogenesis protein OmpA [Tenuifilaceae bacterium CYCD]|nr:cell envelope biogenesis protein OmpA [Tenuifilaceae bacterium CYCD]
MSTKFNILKAIFLGSLILSACVPAKEFQAIQDKNAKCEEEREKLTTENEALNVKSSELESKSVLLKANNDRLVADSANRALEFNKMKEEFSTLKERYADLQQLQDGVMQGSKDETRKLLVQIQRNQEELQQKEDALKELERKLYQRKRGLDNMQADLEKMSKDLEERNARLIELEKILSSKDSIMQSLRKKVADALFGFEGKGLTITMQNGKVYVSLEEKLMFKSGKYEIDAKGATALKQLIPVLEQNADINIMVEGHTDDVPYKGTGDMLDNWDLSVKRATTIVRILLNGTKIDPVRITAAGRSQFLPVDKAKTADARQKNRRTEIILTPKMDEILKLLDNN